MQEATEKTIRGNFDNARFIHYGLASTFFRRNGKYFVRTDGPDGLLREYPIAYTFGIFPLQQYLIAFPGGRYQALNVAWDARPAKEGGQRWFHLYPKEKVAHDDALHWTGPYQNWNFMCAECHSTNVRKNYFPAENRYATTFSEINVSCEACHGPGSAHVEWAKSHPRTGHPAGDRTLRPETGLVVNLRDPARAVWEINRETGLARRTVPRTSRVEVETCGRCHSRRSVAAADYVYGKPLADTHRPAFLDPGLYYPDGQIQDEVYEYGSFLQSKMYAAGVTCTDCHNPHDLKVPVSADRVCLGCHLPARFDNPAHHHHKADSTGSRCTACHMPTRDYMVVHARHDHSFRVPRPDLSLSLGSPSACAGCHRNKTDAWAAEAALTWWGRKRREEPHYGEAIHAGREILPHASEELARLASDGKMPAIVRGTALTLLGRDGGAASPEVLRSAAADPDAFVRRGAVAAAEWLEPSERARLLSPLLSDPVLTVRIDAARALASTPKDLFAPESRARFESALSEWVRSQLVDADRAEAHTALGALAAEQGELVTAEREYRAALKLVPAFGAASANLADLYRLQGREEEGERVLRDGLAASPRDPGLHHALGLALVRMKRHPEALAEFARACELAPDDPRYAYVYGVALESAGDVRRARAVLRRAWEKHPGDREVLQALASFSAKAGDEKAASEYLELLRALARDR
jgi:Flp pilus assembly protein TadD